MTAIERLISILKQQGVFEIYLPFLLTFSIFYALLRKMKIFEIVSGQEGQKDTTANNICIVVSAVAALYVTIFTPAGIQMSQFFATFFTQTSIALVSLVVFMMLAGLLLSLPFIETPKEHIEEWFKKYSSKVLLIGGLLVVFLFVTSGGVNLFTQFGLPSIGISPDDLTLILLVVGTGLIIWFVTKPTKPSGGGGT